MEILGERWTVVVLREVFNGVRRFDDMRMRTGIPRQVLTNRLAMLVEQGVLRREPYREPGQPGAHEYRLTEMGLDLWPVLVAVLGWGGRHLAGRGCLRSASLAPRLWRCRCVWTCAAPSGHDVDQPRDLVPRPAPAPAPYALTRSTPPPGAGVCGGRRIDDRCARETTRV